MTGFSGRCGRLGLRRAGGAPALLLAALLLAGCVDKAASLPPLPDAPQPAYVLGPGDRLRISVFGHDDASGTFIVGPGGKVSTPLVGDIEAGGLTVDEVRAAYTHALEQGYYKDPKVAVEITDYRPFFILGEVTHPGSYPYSSGLTVAAAVAEAGGFTPHADRRRAIIERKTAGTTQAGATQAGATQEGRVGENSPVRPDDIITVPQTIF
jgi:polysaccharide export outer membrane protein